MKPRPLIKWKSFWLGILVLGFLGWAWVRSMTCESSVSYGYGGSGHYCGIYASEGKVTVGHATDTFEQLHGFDVVSFPNEGRQWWPAAVKIGRETKVVVNGDLDEDDLELEDPGEWWVNLAFWFLMLLFFLPWSTFLAWRWRRQRILTKVNEAAPAH